jgi:hypothetical protein
MINIQLISIADNGENIFNLKKIQSFNNFFDSNNLSINSNYFFIEKNESFESE